MPRELSGVLPVIQTPFLDSGRIDSEALERELRWVLDQGVAGLTTGMVSEILRLTDSERRYVAEIVVAVAQERGALAVISCGAESIAAAVGHAQHAEALGADAVMAVAPIDVALDESAIFSYYSAIAEATSIGLVVQDASGYVGRPLSIHLQVRLLAAFGPRIYFKPEAPPIGQRLSQLRDATDGAARAFEGNGGRALVDSFRRGVVGSMPGAEVCWAVQRMWEALLARDWALAYDVSGPLSLLIDMQTSLDAFVAVEKHILKSQGVLSSTEVREPVDYRLDDESRREIDRLVQRLTTVVGRD